MIQNPVYYSWDGFWDGILLLRNALSLQGVFIFTRKSDESQLDSLRFQSWRQFADLLNGLRVSSCFDLKKNSSWWASSWLSSWTPFPEWADPPFLKSLMLSAGKHVIWGNFRDDGDGGGEKLMKEWKRRWTGRGVWELKRREGRTWTKLTSVDGGRKRNLTVLTLFMAEGPIL